jgi:hypothetical protein
MGWLTNYRWLKSLESQRLPDVDYGKRAATKAERKVAKALRQLPGVLDVHHALRLTQIEGGRSRREVDLIALLEDRIVLIEIKLFKGAISMDDHGILHQDGTSRGWSFAKLDDATKRLTDTMGLTGIDLQKTEVHSVLLFQGKGVVDESVTVGKRLTRALVAKNVEDLKSFLQRPLEKESVMDSERLNAVKSFFSYCGTWDQITLNNGVKREGDLKIGSQVDAWRPLYRSLRWSNQRGWFGTLFRGPLFMAKSKGWDGKKSQFEVDPFSEIALLAPNGKLETHRLDHIESVEFGYSTLPNWSSIVLLEPKAVPAPDAKKPPKKQAEGPPYAKNDIIENATVSGIHEEHGIFFTLDAKNSGLYLKRKMQMHEWTMRGALYTVGNSMDVKVIGIRKKGKKGWNIEVKPVE